MLTTHAVGIDLGTTYSCIAYLNEHGEPVTLPNQEGELATPSVVLFDEDEVIVGTEALRNSIRRPRHVVQNSKRYMGDPNHRWYIDGKPYSPVDIATFILKKMLSAAQEQIGPIERAVITVPAQFTDFQRHATMEAGHRAGLQQVDIINEPVAAALCYVLGSEGLWFTELAHEQRILVYDLGGGTFDLSLVRYEKNEVSVIASSGDLNLGGIDWNHKLEEAIASQFVKDFRADPRTDPESLQALALEVEQAKRSLSVRPRAALICQHAGHRKTYQVELAQFEKLGKPLVERTAEITKKLLKDNHMGWAHVDVVLTTGGASRMPMIRKRLKELSGRTTNKALSPDHSIAHGATYYAGMLLTNSKFARSILNKEATERLSQVRQRSVNARELGILVRDKKKGMRFPFYLIDRNTPLPASGTHNFGTVVPNQRRVHLQIIESGTSAEQPPVKLGACVIDELPPNLPEGSQIAVTIRYDEQARVHVEAKDVTSGKLAHTEIIRQENLVPQLESKWIEDEDVELQMVAPPPGEKKGLLPTGRPATAPPATTAAIRPPVAPVSAPPPSPAGKPKPALLPLEQAERPVPLCNRCGEPLDPRGNCPQCGVGPGKSKAPARPVVKRPPAQATRATPPASDSDILELGQRPAPARPKKRKDSPPARGQRPDADVAAGEEEFWQIVD